MIGPENENIFNAQTKYPVFRLSFILVLKFLDLIPTLK